MKKYFLFFFFFLLAFIIRIIFVKQGLTGDITAFTEWGQKFWQVGAKDFYFHKEWFYTFPTYPPLSTLLFAGIYWLDQHQYVLAQIHNSLGIIPPSFMLFLGKVVPENPFMFTYGYFFLLKLLPILADLITAFIIYKIILKIGAGYKKAWFGFLLYLFNPVTIFLSGVWGQTESLVALFSLLAFLFIYDNKVYLSIPFFFIGFYLKPSWILLTPFYLYVLYHSYVQHHSYVHYHLGHKLRGILIGLFISALVFVITTEIFSNGNILSFTRETVLSKMLPGMKGTAKLSISAFNFYTIFWKIDRVLVSKPVSFLSTGLFVVINWLAFNLVRKSKKKDLLAIISGIFLVSMGSYLFLTSMLERYFFPAFAAMIILISINFKQFLKLLLVNLILFVNLFWSFYRRGSDEIDHLFTNHNFLFIRLLSLVIVGFFVQIMLQFKRGRGDWVRNS